MKLFISTLLCTLSVSVFAADDVTLTISKDFDGDGQVDQASLVTSAADSDFFDLVLSFATGDQILISKAAYNQNLSEMVGLGTELTLNKAGSLQIRSYNDAVGRSRFENWTTFAYRKDQMVLAGMTLSWRDTLDMTSGTCDLNFLSQKGVVEERTSENAQRKEVRLPDLVFPMSSVTDDLQIELADAFCRI